LLADTLRQQRLIDVAGTLEELLNLDSPGVLNAPSRRQVFRLPDFRARAAARNLAAPRGGDQSR
jgi:hypothetical protein